MKMKINLIVLLISMIFMFSQAASVDYNLNQIQAMAVTPERLQAGYLVDGVAKDLIKTRTVNVPKPISSTGYFCVYSIFFSNGFNLALQFSSGNIPGQFRFQRTGFGGSAFYKFYSKACFGNNELTTSGGNFSITISTDYFYFEKLIVFDACPPTCSSCNSSGVCDVCYPGYGSSVITLGSGVCSCSASPCNVMFTNFYNYNTSNCSASIGFHKFAGNYGYSFCEINPPSYSDVPTPASSLLIKMSNVPDYPTYTCPVGKVLSVAPGVFCTDDLCGFPAASISAAENGFTTTLSIPTGTTNIKIEFTDPNNILSGLNFFRYSMQVFLVDEYGDKISHNGSVIQGTQSNVNSASLTITEAIANLYCKLVDANELSKGKACYFSALISDNCSSSFGTIAYYHLAQRIIHADDNGIHVLQDLAVTQNNLTIDYCHFFQSCFISTRYNFAPNLCTAPGSPCITINNPNFKYRKNDQVNLQIAFTDKSGNTVSGKNFSITSLKTKLYTANNVAVDTPERDVTILGTPTTLGNLMLFGFILNENLLFYENADLISLNVRLIIVARISPNTRRYLEIDQMELIPQNGGLLTINFDPEEVAEFQTKVNTKSKSYLVVIGILVAVIILAILGIGAYCLFFKKKKEVVSSEFKNVEIKADGSPKYIEAPKTDELKHVRTGSDFNTNRSSETDNKNENNNKL